MEAFLIIVLNLLVLAGIVLIFLFFRLDRMSFRIETRWKTVWSLLRIVADKTLDSDRLTADDKHRIEKFMKIRKQAAQVAAANELQPLFELSDEDAAFLTEYQEQYNRDVQALNQMLEKPLWHFVATIFRVKQRLPFEASTGTY